MAQIFRAFSVLLALFLFGCGTTKSKFIKLETTKNDSVYIKRDSVVSTIINQGINDTVFLPISTGSTKLDSVLVTRLAYFKTGKKSGANSYDIRFDSQAKGFKITSSIKQTQNKIERKHDSINKRKATKVRKEHKEVKTKARVPMWLFIVFMILLLMVYLLSKFNII